MTIVTPKKMNHPLQVLIFKEKYLKGCDIIADIFAESSQ